MNVNLVFISISISIFTFTFTSPAHAVPFTAEEAAAFKLILRYSLKKTTLRAAAYTELGMKKYGPGFKHTYSRPEEEFHTSRITALQSSLEDERLKIENAIKNDPVTPESVLEHKQNRVVYLHKKKITKFEIKFHRIHAKYLASYRRDGSSWKRVFLDENCKIIPSSVLVGVAVPPIYLLVTGFIKYVREEEKVEKLETPLFELAQEAKDQAPEALEYMKERMIRDRPIAKIPQETELKKALLDSTPMSEDVIENILVPLLNEK